MSSVLAKSKSAVTALADALGNLKRTRPTEMDSAFDGIGEIHYDGLAETIETISSRIDYLSSGKWMSAEEQIFFDIQLSAKIGLVTNHINNGINHGARWLIHQSEFMISFSDLTTFVSLFMARKNALNSLVAKQLEKRGVSELEKVVHAGPISEKIAKFASQSEASIVSINQKVSDADSILERASEIGDQADTLEERTSAINKLLDEREVDSERLHSEILSYKNKSEEMAGSFENRILELTSKSFESETALEESTKMLRDALKNVKRQGLAGAFTDRAERTEKDRKFWSSVFVLAILMLVLLSILFVTDLTELTYQVLVVSLLRRVAIAAPAIWIGWYAAKQIGRLNRIQEDYEYKAATALAFESYRDEIVALGDDSLRAQLLKTTIDNFGSNPVRLYDNSDSEPSTPLEDLLSRLDAEGNLGKLSKLAGLFNKS